MSEEINLNGRSGIPGEDPEKTVFNESEAENKADAKGEVDEAPESVPDGDSAQEAPLKRSPLHSGWKAVTIGGVSGIMLGAAPFAFGSHDGKETAEDAPAAPAGLEPESPVQEPVQAPVGKAHNLDDMSFGQAFASARAELGPGEVFEWRGGLYTTDTKEEWEAAHPSNDEVFVAEDDDASVDIFGPAPDVAPDDVYVDVEEDDGMEDDAAEEEIYVAEVDDGVETDDGSEVVLVGLEAVQTEDGQMSVGVLSGEDEAIIVDVDDDGTFDAMAADFNGDGYITDDEVVDISHLEITVDDFGQDGTGMDPDPSAGMDF